MQTTRVEPEVRCVSTPPAQTECDLIGLPVFENDELTELEGLDTATAGELSRARASGEFRGKPNDLFVARLGDVAWRASRVALVGIGSAGDGTVDRLRTAASMIVRAADRQRLETVAFVGRGTDSSRAGQAIAEGLLLGSFEDRSFKTDDSTRPPAVKRCAVVAPATASSEWELAVATGQILATAANHARELANAPGNVLTPTVFADRAHALVSMSGISTDVLDEVAIAAHGMGLLLAVARGSVEPPRVIVMRHEPADAPPRPILALIGKGITFDSGGISLKPADGMDRMKEDMAGGAAVVCAMRAIGALRLPVRVVGVVPTAENMPGGRATKPGDILTSASGTTVEVNNTDAEGRLILGDALWYARQQGATHLVDVATLTGACVVALGKVASGLFGQPTSWVDAVQEAASRAGERVWPLPIYDEYAEQLRSEMADIVNSGGRSAGASTAAAFLKTFAGDQPWAHIDIAGTAWADEAKPYLPRGATGVMVRTLTELARTSQSW